MASLYRCLHIVCNPSRLIFPKYGVSNSTLGSVGQNTLNNTQVLLVKNTVQPSWNAYRYSYSFFSRVTANQLWKGVTSVSPAGRKKGRARGKGRKVAVDLNKGQVIGFGKKNMVWPGLNYPILRGKEVITQQQLPPDESRQQRIVDMRNRLGTIKRFKLTPLERGFSGTRLPGRSIGPPDPVGDETFEGFDTKVLQFRTLWRMVGKRGRQRTLSAFVVTGNKKGLAGFAVGKATTGTTALTKAKNRAVRKLRYIERANEHTVLHDFIVQFGAVTIFVKRKPEGFGLICHRGIRVICEMLGIKDIHAKVEGPTHNYQNVTKAFFIGLMRQKPLQQVAEEKGLHVIEFRNDRDNYPQVVASPSRCRTEEEIPVDEIMDFKVYLHGGKVEKFVEPFQPFYINFPGYLKRQKELLRFRNQKEVKLQLIARYDGIKSFLTVREEEKAKLAVKNTVEAET